MKNKFGLLSFFSKLGKDVLACCPRPLARLLSDEEGSYLMLTILVLPALIGIGGLAGEASLLSFNKRTLQSAADAAAYSAAISYSFDSSSTNATTQANAIVQSYGFALGSGSTVNEANVTVQTPPSNTFAGMPAVTVQISRPQTAMFSSMYLFSSLPNVVSATAVIFGGFGSSPPPTGGGNCLLALGSTGTDITLSGTPSVNLIGCGVYSNSNISVGGNGSLTAGSVGAVGTVSVTGSANIGPPPTGYTTGDGTETNPYSPLSNPSNPLITPGSCVDGSGGVTGNISGHQTATLNPGTYCNGISSLVHSSVTLNPGTYIFDGNNSQLLVDSQSSLTGVGVTLVFTDPGSAAYPKVQGQAAAMNISSGATVDLQAPAANATLGMPGMLIIGASNVPTPTAFELWANSGTSTGISGVITVPTGNFTWGGGPILAGGCTQFIADTLSLQGNATFDNTACDFSSGGGGGGGGSGILPIGNVVTLVD